MSGVVLDRAEVIETFMRRRSAVDLVAPTPTLDPRDFPLIPLTPGLLGFTIVFASQHIEGKESLYMVKVREAVGPGTNRTSCVEVMGIIGRQSGYREIELRRCSIEQGAIQSSPIKFPHSDALQAELVRLIDLILVAVRIHGRIRGPNDKGMKWEL